MRGSGFRARRNSARTDSVCNAMWVASLTIAGRRQRGCRILSGPQRVRRHARGLQATGRGEGSATRGSERSQALFRRSVAAPRGQPSRVDAVRVEREECTQSTRLASSEGGLDGWPARTGWDRQVASGGDSCQEPSQLWRRAVTEHTLSCTLAVADVEPGVDCRALPPTVLNKEVRRYGVAPGSGLLTTTPLIVTSPIEGPAPKWCIMVL